MNENRTPADQTPGQQTPESITAMLHERARANGTTFAQEYRNYHPEVRDES